tara:strand:+ start:1219 stop:1638 length:420 start_codon:yes stop_codon:yes gene_type:complete
MALKQIGRKELKTSRAFKDIAIAFGRNPFTDDANVVKNENAIKQSIRNLILTVPGEKPFQPLVGSAVNELLFEPIDPFTVDSLRDEILNTITQHEPRVGVDTVDIQPQYDNNDINVTVIYRIIGQPIVEEISFVLQRPE